MEMMSKTPETEGAHRFPEKNQLFCKVINRQVAHKVTYRGAFCWGNLSLFGPKLAILKILEGNTRRQDLKYGNQKLWEDSFEDSFEESSMENFL